MNGSRPMCRALCAVLSVGLGLGWGFAAAADALSTLNDAELFGKAQADVAQASRGDLEALLPALAACSAVSIGQRMQQFECEKGLTVYWGRYNRERALDNYLTALGGLFVGFDNNAVSPTPEMMQAYRRTANNLLALIKDINVRYRQLDK